MFEEKHLLNDGEAYFAPSAQMALAWQRLTQGKGTKTDIMLLNHEYTELAFMQKKGYTYRKAHWLADVRYPWEFEVSEKEWTHDTIRKTIRDSLNNIL